MIYITGDTHGDWMSRLNAHAFPEQKEMTKDDTVIICGDFGIWNDTKQERYNLDWLENKPFTTLFVDGNHSNFDRLYAMPVSEWHGGKVHFIRPSIIHLMRGQVFNIEGKTFWTFGGASSHDIRDGVLEIDDPRLRKWRYDYEKGDGKAHTAQQTIPYLQMYPDGICRITEKKYSKSVVFEDINYQLAQADDKTAIFENWCDFLNYFDASVSVQLSFINQGTQRGEAEKAIDIPARDDAFNSIRAEYSDMLKNQLSKGNNGLVKYKYITFSIEADSLAAAKARLARIETDVLNNFKVLGVAARPMTGYDRLKVLHGVFHPEGEPFSFDWAWLAPSGLSTKDFIAPPSFRFGEGRTFRMGRKIGAVSFLQILAPELNDRILSDILDLETGVIVNLHIRSIDQSEAIKTIKRKITDLDKMKIEEQKKAVRSGYDMDIIPSDLATFGNEAKNLLQDLQSRNERMFLLTFLVANMADTKRKLENDVFAAAGIAQKYNCALTRLDYQQEAGLLSCVPIGENLVPIQRGLTTSSTAIFIPFITQELCAGHFP